MKGKKWKERKGMEEKNEKKEYRRKQKIENDEMGGIKVSMTNIMIEIKNKINKDRKGLIIKKIMLSFVKYLFSFLFFLIYSAISRKVRDLGNTNNP